MSQRGSREENRTFWRMAIEMQLESGFSIAEFCRREGLQQATYYAWRRKLTQGPDDSVQEAPDDDTSAELVPVHVIDDHHGAVEVVSPEGYVVRVPQDAATENVRRVLQGLHDAR